MDLCSPKKTSTQYCIEFNVSYPYELILDDLGNQILYFTFENLPPYGTKIITIQANLSLSHEANPIPMQDLQPFLRAEKYIESDDPELSLFAKRFKAQKPVETAESIYRWIIENISYEGYSSDDRGALYALRNRKGDCTEFMYLFAALCRANGIPARGMGGYIMGDTPILKPNDYHNWAEFYMDGAWNISDPQRKVFMKNQSNYIAMEIIGESDLNPIGKCHRFRYAGDGLKAKMNK